MSQDPLLIVTLPARSVGGLRDNLRAAGDAGADVAEVRLDRLPPTERRLVLERLPSPVPLLVTLRSRAEGGEGPDDPAERAALLRPLIRGGAAFVDLELARDRDLIDETTGSEGDATVKFLSAHLPESASTSDIQRTLDAPRPDRAVIKVVLPCSYDRLWNDLLPNLFPLDSVAPFVFHTTGPTGPLFRAWAHRFGMYAIFSALPETGTEGAASAVEPSQIPVDRLRDLGAKPAEAPLFAVVGHPIGHSRSPAIHSMWIHREHRRGLFLALDIGTSQELASSVGPLADGGFRGLNVTHPWKEIALGLASRAGPAAEAAGCANTLTFESGAVAAENTDVAAARRRLVELRETGRWDDSPVAVLGAGGAARSMLAALSSLGRSAIIVARRQAAAEKLARKYGWTAWTGSARRPARLIVHATPAGREGEPPLALPWEALVGPGSHVVDFVYAAADPFLQRGTIARGGTYEDGSRLLVYQAAESYALWWGSPPSAELQNQALREVLCAA